VNLLIDAAGAVGGAIVGSFLANLIVRWPRDEQVSSGRSRCDSCTRTLSAWELVPIVSAIANRGRCRTCRAPIASEHIWVELTAAALSAIALILQPNLYGVALAAFWLLLLAPAVLDARHLWLPDQLTILLAAAGLLFGTFVSGETLADRVIGGAVGFGSLWLIARGYSGVRGREGLGAGDPKFLGAIGLWTGWQAIPLVVLLAALAGMAVAIVQRRSQADRMPFGTLLAFGAMIWTGAFAAFGPRQIF
jgi:leader peptidase (prepilin peptidase)/N-methyltransferase